MVENPPILWVRGKVTAHCPLPSFASCWAWRCVARSQHWWTSRERMSASPVLVLLDGLPCNSTCWPWVAPSWPSFWFWWCDISWSTIGSKRSKGRTTELQIEGTCHCCYIMRPSFRQFFCFHRKYFFKTFLKHTFHDVTSSSLDIHC